MVVIIQKSLSFDSSPRLKSIPMQRSSGYHHQSISSGSASMTKADAVSRRREEGHFTARGSVHRYDVDSLLSLYGWIVDEWHGTTLLSRP